MDVVKKMTTNAGPNNLSNIYICNSDPGHIVNTPGCHPTSEKILYHECDRHQGWTVMVFFFHGAVWDGVGV